MTHMKKILIAFAASAMTAGMVGCNDFLDTMPDNRTQIDNLEKVEALLVSAYSNRSFIAAIDAGCDGYVDHGSTYDGTQPDEAYNVHVERAYLWSEYPSSEGNETPEEVWGASYEAIAAANIALESIEELIANGTITESEAKSARAEALLCRAYNHFVLLTLFADFFDRDNWDTKPGIPYVTERETVVIKQYDRETVRATLDKVKADLQEGMKGISSAKNKFHFSYNAALAFATRVALFEGDYASVVMYVNQLIPTASTYLTLGTNADGTIQRTPDSSDGAYIYVSNNFSNWEYIGNQAGTSAVAVAFSDPRYNSSILLAAECVSLLGRTAWGNILARYSPSSKTMNSIVGTNPTGRGWNYPLYSASSSVGFVPKYYEDFHTTNISANTGIPYDKIILFRMEEMLLARAEANAILGNYDQALDDLNLYPQNRIDVSASESTETVIRDAALTRDKVLAYYAATIDNADHYINSSYNAGMFSGSASDPSGRLERALVLTALDFRRAEFLHEGMRWFDILRWHIPVTHSRISGESSTLTPDDDRRVLQIPATAELSGLEKNPRNTPDW